MQYPTRIVGDATKVISLDVSAGPCRLVAFLGHNHNASSDIYIQAHALNAAELEGGETPVLTVLATAGLPFSCALPAPVGFDKLCLIGSSTADTLTAIESADLSIQAILVA